MCIGLQEFMYSMCSLQSSSLQGSHWLYTYRWFSLVIYILLYKWKPGQHLLWATKWTNGLPIVHQPKSQSISPAHGPVHQSCPPVQSRVLRLLQPICVLIGTIWDHVITAMLAQYVLQPSFDIIAGTISFVAGYSQYIKVFHTRQKHRMVNRSRSMRLFPNWSYCCKNRCIGTFLHRLVSMPNRI